MTLNVKPSALQSQLRGCDAISSWTPWDTHAPCADVTAARS
jgi:hypothetical protein